MVQPTAQEIRRQLRKITESVEFQKSSHLCRFLEYVTEETLKGNTDRLKAYTIAVDALGKSTNFDPQSDSVVRSYASMLRKALAGYYENEGKNDAVVIEIPKGSYVPIFSGKNEAEKKVLKVYPSEVPTIKALNKSRILFIGIALVLISAIFSLLVFYPRKAKNEAMVASPSLAIFEFENLTNEKENEAWIKGFANELVITNSKYDFIDIIGPIPLAEENAFKKLVLETEDKNNYYSLNGDIKKSDSILLVNVIIQNLLSEKVVWAETFESDIQAKNLLEISKEISTNIAQHASGYYGVVQSELLKSYIKEKANKGVHLAILRYFSYLRSLKREENQQLISEFEEIISDYPEYAPAYGALSGLYLDAFGRFGADSLECITKAENYMKEGLLLDYENFLVQHERMYLAYLKRDIPELNDAISYFEKQNPSSLFIGTAGVYLIMLGEDAKGYDLIRRAKGFSLIQPDYYHIGLFFYHFRRENYEQAFIEAESINAPDFYLDYVCRAAALNKLGRTDKAAKIKEEMFNLFPEIKNNIKTELLKRIVLETDVEILVDAFDLAE